MTPSNIRAVQDAIDGRFVEIAWDDTATGISRFKFFSKNISTGAYTEITVTSSTVDKVAIVPPGITLRVQNVLSNGNQYPGPDFVVPAAQMPPAPLDAIGHLAAATGVVVAAGWRVMLQGTAGSQAWYDVTPPDIVGGSPPAPPVPLTAEQHLEAALGVAVNAGDQVAVYPVPSKVVTVHADGSVA